MCLSRHISQPSMQGQVLHQAQVLFLLLLHPLYLLGHFWDHFRLALPLCAGIGVHMLLLLLLLLLLQWGHFAQPFMFPLPLPLPLLLHMSLCIHIGMLLQLQCSHFPHPFRLALQPMFSHGLCNQYSQPTARFLHNSYSSRHRLTSRFSLISYIG